MDSFKNLLKSLVYLIRAFPRLFGNVFASVPYLNILIKFFPEMISLIKQIKISVKEHGYERTKKRLVLAKDKINSDDLSSRLEGIDELEDIINGGRSGKL
ncbi:hypothetical protein KAU11_04465 [Candidatus Babeliales bacterium]|nr:hypothetical protein [Candidatus Babeliales bacterium]